MEVQSNNIAASLFDGLSQSQQTQGTATKNDLFSKMMDRMLTDAAARKREQADTAARDSAKDAAKEAAKDAAKDARDARAAEAQRRQPVRAEPKPDLTRDKGVQSPRQPDAIDAPRAAGPKAGKADDDRKVEARQDDRRPAKTEKPAKDQSKTDGARAGADKANAEKTDEAKADGTADAGDAAASDDTASADAGGQADGAGADDSNAQDAAAGEQAAAQLADPLTNQSTGQPADQPLPVVQPVPPQPMPQASDLILAGLMPAGKTAATDSTDDSVGGGDAATAGAAAPVDPAAQLAQAQAAAAGAVTAGAAGQAETGAPAKAAGKTDAVNGDAAQTAEAVQAEAGTQAGAEALPTDDDTALPDRFADLLAAAKAKAGEASQTGKHAGTEGGGRNDAQPQAQTMMPQPTLTAAAAPAAPVAEAVTAVAANTAAKALEGVEGTGSAGTSAAASPHTHPTLAAMEGLHSGIPGFDQTQAATATLRPSRGAGMPMGVQDQIAVHIKKSVADDVDQFTINLHPAELGRIDIKLDIGADGRVNATVAVERAQTLELLQRDSRSLERALQDAGLQTDSNSLNFSLRGEGNPFAGGGQGDGKGTGSGRRGRGFGGGDDDDGADSTVYTATLGNGRVDIRA